MLCPVLIDRTAEMHALTSALDAAGQGRGGTVFVTGDAGVGKSRLVREVTAEAARRRFSVLTGRATQSSVPVPFRPISEALMGAARSGVVPDAPVIADYRAALGTLVPEWSLPTDGNAEVSPLIIGEALLRLLSLPDWPASLLVLEDLHWADPETAVIVEYLADNTGSAPIAVLCTMRDTAPSPAHDLLRSVTARRVATTVEVPRLDPSAVTEMTAACLGVAAVPPAVASLLADCDGLPFAVEEILAAARSAGQLVPGPDGWHVDGAVVTGVPSSIVGSVHNRIAALGPAARNVLVSAAVLGRQFDWALLPGVAEVGEADVLDALHQAHDMQLIEPVCGTPDFRFRHSLTREAIVSDLLQPELASRSARAAAAIEAAHPGLPGAWCELAAELKALAGQRTKAAGLLLTAGQRDLQQGALTSAISTLHDARRLLADSPSGNPLIDDALVDAVALSGDYAQLERLVADVLGKLGGTDPRREALIRIRAASTRPQDNPDAAAAHLAAASAIAEQLAEPELTSRVDAVGARYALVAGDLDRAEKLASRALAAAEDADLAGWAADVALESIGVLGRRERIRDPKAARALFERAYKIADQRGLGVWRIRSLHDLATIEMLVSGQTSELIEVRTVALQGGLFTIGTLIDLQLANLWSLGPDLDKALVTARKSEAGARRIRSGRIEAMAILLQALAQGVKGDGRAAEQTARRAEAVIPGDPEVMLTSESQVKVLTALFRDDVRHAVRHSANADEYAAQMLSAPRRALGFYSPAQVPLVARGRSWGLRALLAASTGGDTRNAIEQAEKVGAAVSWNRGCLAYAEAVLAGHAGQRDRATSLAVEGAAAFAPFAPWWNDLARRLVAQSAIDNGWGEPVPWMHEAAARFASTGHVQLATACRGILRRAGVPVPRSGRGNAQVPPQLQPLGVTSREMDVYLLVARGCSNAEIADRLFISPKTVETHIAKLIAKTGQAGRRELVAHAARNIQDLAAFVLAS
jgi:DNA-binding CsgD family transcriptional regulator/tetratricopeptide (TPR) repeat protein